MESKILHLKKIKDTYWTAHFIFYITIMLLFIINNCSDERRFNNYYYLLWMGIYIVFILGNLIYYMAVKEKLNGENNLFQILYSVTAIGCATIFSSTFNFGYTTVQFIFIFFIILISLTCKIKVAIISAFLISALNFLFYHNYYDVLVYIHSIFYLLIAWVVGSICQINLNYARQLNKSKQFLANVIDSFTEGIFITNSERIVILCNNQIKQIFNCSPLQVIGQSEEQIWGNCSVTYDELTATGFTNKEVEIKGRKYLISRFGINEDSNTNSNYVIVINDVMELERHKQQIQNLKMLSAIGELSAGLVHEIKNPLTTIKGFVQLIMSEIKGSKYYRMSEVVIDELDRINFIITNLLQMSKSDTGEYTEINLNDIISRTWDLYTYNGLSKGIRFDKELYTDLPPIWGSLKQIQQVILNLLQNAEKACQKGDKVLLRTYLNDELVCIDVTDTGEGIPAEKLDKIMLPFYTGDYNGNGLGLAICNKIILEHKGTIEVNSKLGVGTTMSVKFKPYKANLSSQSELI